MRGFGRILRDSPMVIVTTCVLLVVLGLLALGHPEIARIVASVYVAGFTAYTAWHMLRDIVHGHWGLDILAVVAMVSTVAVDEYIAAVLIVLMLTGGHALETYAAGRARRELDALLARAPRMAHVVDGDSVTDRQISEVAPGDTLLVKSAEVVPVDGLLLDTTAETDESSLTGESLPVTHDRHDSLLSGSVNLGRAIRIEATAAAADSQYQQIVALVRQAQESKSPIVRLADRFAIPFTAASLLIAGLAWSFSGDAARFAEVLVLATPCPLLIGAPVAFISGMSRSAGQGVIVKSGGSIELLARIKSAAFDKTGTLTTGRPSLVDIRPEGDVSADRLLQLVASLEQYSTHALASSVMEAAAARRVELLPATGAREIATDGIDAMVASHRVLVGKPRFVQEAVSSFERATLAPGELAIYAAVDESYAGTLIMRDPLRHNSVQLIEALSSLGVEHTVVLTGDAASTASHVGAELGLTDVRAELLPADKVRLVQELPDRPVAMVGDGVNDAPVLAAADVGVAMGARGATAASESADVVILADDIGKVATAMSIARRTVRVAYTSIGVGIGLSTVLMLIAALGHIPAVLGAITQEGVDLLAIGVALLALRPGRGELHL